MTKSEVALKIMGIISKNPNQYSVNCSDTGVFYITINKDIISFTDTELRIETGNGYIRSSFSNIYSINVYHNYTVIHFQSGSTYLLNYKGGK